MTGRELSLLWEDQNWLTWPGSPNVQVSSFGSVITENWQGKRAGTGNWREVEYSLNGSGYLSCSYGFVHRLVAETWILNPFGLTDVNHIDGDKMHNAVENLEWSSHSDNIQHAKNALNVRFGPVVFPVRILETGEIFKSAGAVAKAINGDKANICRVLSGKQPHYRNLHFERVYNDQG